MGLRPGTTQQGEKCLLQLSPGLLWDCVTGEVGPSPATPPRSKDQDPTHISDSPTGPLLPLQVELEVLEDAPARQEGATEACEDLPAIQVAGTARVWDFVGLFDELAVELVTQWAQVMARLQDALDDGDGVGHGLQLLQGVEDLDGFILQCGVAFVLEHWGAEQIYGVTGDFGQEFRE